jgi:hypothetical protein
MSSDRAEHNPDPERTRTARRQQQQQQQQKTRFAKSKINEKKNDDKHQSPDAGQAVCSGEWR